MGKRSTDNIKPIAMTVLAAVMLLLIALGANIQSHKPKDLPPYLSFSADADGLKGLRTLMELKAGPVKEWRESWTVLPGGAGHTLLAVEPGSVGEKEKQPLLNWIAQGNRLIIFSKHIPAYLVRPEIGLESADQPHPVNPEATVIRYDGAGGGDGIRYKTRTPDAVIRLKETGKAQVLLKDEQGILAARYPYKNGTVVMVLTPEWLWNSSILQDEQFEAVWPLLLGESQGYPVWIDEFHHGYSATRTWSQVYPVWLLAAFGQACLAAVLWLLYRGKRFGPVHTPREWVVRRGDETLLAVAGWHRRRSLRLDAIGEQEQYLRQLLQERWGIRVEAEPEEAAAVALIYGGERLAGQLELLLKRLRELPAGKRYSNKQFLADCLAVAHIVEGLERRSVHS